MSRSAFGSHLLQLAAIGLICLNTAAAQQEKPAAADKNKPQPPIPRITNGPFLSGSTQIKATVDTSINDAKQIHVQVSDDPNHASWREISFNQNPKPTLSSGTFTGEVSEKLNNGQYVEIGEESAGSVKWSPPASVTDALGEAGGLFLRTIVGFNQTGASSAQSVQQFFFDLYTSTPLRLGRVRKSDTGVRSEDQSNTYDLGSPYRVWGDLRIESAPQQITSTVSQLSVGFAQAVGNLTVNQVARSFEFLGGLEVRVAQTPGVNLSFGRNSSEKVAVSLVAAGGLITPLSANDSATIYSVPTNQPNFFQVYPQATGAKFVVFTVPDRTRFFREAYGGLRFTTQSFDIDGFASRRKLPATFDLTYGFNETVTGGAIHGGVTRIEGFIPIPVSVKPLSSVYLFGAAYFRLKKTEELPPLLLNSAPAGTLFTDPSAVVITAERTTRDYYRVGIGVDLIKVVTSWNATKPQ